MQEVGEAERARLSSATRSASQSSPVVSPTTDSVDGPASSTPDSSNVSRTAAATYAAAVSAEHPSRSPNHSGGGPDHESAMVASVGVDPAAGEDRHTGRERHRLLPPQQVDLRAGGRVAQQDDRGRGARLGRHPRFPRRGQSASSAIRPDSSSTSSPNHALSRAARSPCGGWRRSAARRGDSWPPRPEVSDLDDEFDLDRGVEGEDRDADGAAGVLAGLTEDGAEQLRGAVGDLGLAGEVRGRGDESDGLDDPLDVRQVADLGLDRGQGVQRALLGALAGDLGGDGVADLAGGDQGALAQRQLAGGVDQIAGPDAPGRRRRPAWPPRAASGRARPASPRGGSCLDSISRLK